MLNIIQHIEEGNNFNLLMEGKLRLIGVTEEQTREILEYLKDEDKEKKYESYWK
jgi:hypothetical protein